MKYISLKTLFVMLAVYTSCQGQTNADIPKNAVNTKNKDIVTSEVPRGVFDIKQDRKGDIWIATNTAVYRYDGKSFSNLTGKDISARFISVLGDRKGNLWFATLGSGVYSYNGKWFRNYTTNDGLASNHVSCMYEDRAGNIWFGTNDGASRYDGKSFRKLKMRDTAAPASNDSVHVSAYQLGLPANSSLHNDIHTIIEDKAGKLWFGTRGDTFIYNGKTFTTLLNKDGKALSNVWRIVEDRKGNIWFASDGLWRYKDSTLAKINHTGGGVIVEDKKGNILASSGGSIFLYNQQSLSDKEPHVTEIKTSYDGRRNLPFGLLGANDGSIWFASFAGLSRYDGKAITDFKGN